MKVILRKVKSKTIKSGGRKIRQAIIFAGGAGTRLAPFTATLPKPLMPVGETPIIEILARQLFASGIKEIIVALGHGAKLIKLFLGDGTDFGGKVRYITEKTPLGTAGPLRKISGLDQNFLALNGDLLTDIDFSDFARFHLSGKSPVSIAVCRRTEKSDFGIVVSNDELVTAFSEKPSRSFDVSMGIYAFSRDTLKYIPPGRFDFPELISTLLGLDIQPRAYKFQGAWLDIGRHEDWEKASKLYKRNPSRFIR